MCVVFLVFNVFVVGEDIIEIIFVLGIFVCGFCMIFSDLCNFDELVREILGCCICFD